MADVRIVESYRGWRPTLNAKGIVGRLVAGLPEDPVRDLARIVLTNSTALDHRRRRTPVFHRGRRVPIRTVSGMYHHAWRGEAPWIELLVDNLEKRFSPLPLWLCRFPPLADFHFGTTLFHEIGHHIHATQGPSGREVEDVADSWSARLLRHHMLRQYPWLRWTGRRIPLQVADFSVETCAVLRRLRLGREPRR
jgi:hypothetical protein